MQIPYFVLCTKLTEYLSTKCWYLRKMFLERWYDSLITLNILNTNCQIERVWNIIFIRGIGWYVIIKVWKTYNSKIEVVSFVIMSGWKLTTGIKFEVNVKKWGRRRCFVVSFISSSSIYMKVKVKLLASVINDIYIISWSLVDLVDTILQEDQLSQDWLKLGLEK